MQVILTMVFVKGDKMDGYIRRIKRTVRCRR